MTNYFVIEKELEAYVDDDRILKDMTNEEMVDFFNEIMKYRFPIIEEHEIS